MASRQNRGRQCISDLFETEATAMTEEPLTLVDSANNIGISLDIPTRPAPTTATPLVDKVEQMHT